MWTNPSACQPSRAHAAVTALIVGLALGSTAAPAGPPAAQPRAGVDYDAHSVLVRIRPHAADADSPGWRTIAERDHLVARVVAAAGLTLDRGRAPLGYTPLYRESVAAEMARTGRSEAELLGRYYGFGECYMLWLAPDRPHDVAAEALRRLERAAHRVSDLDITATANFLRHAAAAAPAAPTPGRSPTDGAAPPRGAGWPNDPEYVAGNQWALTHIDVETAWQLYSIGSPDTVVAVIDTGIDEDHPDLWKKIENCEVFPSGSCDDVSPEGHGTKVAGVIAAATNNGTGIAGVCPACELMILKAGEVTLFLDSNILNALAYAVQNGAHVINMSFGSFYYNPLYLPAIQYARDNCVTVVAAAGEGSEAPDYLPEFRPFYPAAFPGVIAVTGTDQGDVLVTLGRDANYGTWVDLSAPGQDILTTLNDGGYVTATGTSLAAAHVSGLVGLLRWEVGLLWCHEDLLFTMRDTGANIDPLNRPAFADRIGRRIDAGAALARQDADLFGLQPHFALVDVQVTDPLEPPDSPEAAIMKQGRTAEIALTVRNLSSFFDVPAGTATLREAGGAYVEDCAYAAQPLYDGREFLVGPFTYPVALSKEAFVPIALELDIGVDTLTFEVFPNHEKAVLVRHYYDQQTPDVSGNRVVWNDWRDWSAGSPDNSNLWMMTFGGEETQVTDDANGNRQEQPSIDLGAGLIVYRNLESSFGSIYSYQISGGAVEPICHQEIDERREPVVKGHWVVWKDERGGYGAELFGYDLQNDQEVQLTSVDTPGLAPPRIELLGNEHVLAWADTRTGSSRVYAGRIGLDDLDTVPPVLGNFAGDQVYPDIGISADGQLCVVFSDAYDIWLIDDINAAAVAARKMTAQPPGAVFYFNGFPRVSGDWIVYEHFRAYDDQHVFLDVYARHPNVAHEIKLSVSHAMYDANDMTGAFSPSIDGPHVVWTDMRRETQDIFHAYLGELPVISFAGFELGADCALTQIAPGATMTLHFGDDTPVPIAGTVERRVTEAADGTTVWADASPVAVGSDGLWTTMPISLAPETAYVFAARYVTEAGFVTRHEAAFTLPGEPPTGDIDGDCQVTAADFVLIAGCLAGPDVHTPPPGCDPQHFDSSDLDEDGDVDLRDFAEFQQLCPTR